MNLHLLEKLDYTIYSDKERTIYVESLLDNSPYAPDLTNSSEQKQLEGLANYILYGKDEDTDKSLVDTKLVEIETKFSSFTKKKPESLDALQESVTFNERDLREYYVRNIYTKPKQRICRENDAWIPTMASLWTSIDQMQRIYDVSTGKEEPVPGERPLEGLRQYKWRHWLIDVRRHQFYLRDIFAPTIHFLNVKPPDEQYVDFSSDSRYVDEDGREVVVREHTLDLTNPDHIYHLLEHYSALKQNCYEDTESPMRFILYSLEEIVDKTDLAPPRRDILVMKVDKRLNLRIRDHLQVTYGLNYSENYISTIWKKEICVKVAAQARLMLDEFLARGDEEKWKVCRVCRKKKLRDEREFVRRSVSLDGFSSRCKVCDREERERKKGRQ